MSGTLTYAELQEIRDMLDVEGATIETVAALVVRFRDLERERIAKLADELDATYETSEPNPDPPGGWIVTHHSFANRIREGQPFP